MKTKQTVAVFGASGSMGSAITKSIAKGPYRLLLLSNEPEKLQKLQSDILKEFPDAEAEAVQTLIDARWKADIFILAVPYSSEKEIVQEILDMAEGKIVISITNPINKDLSGLVTPPGTSAAEELQKLLPKSKVIKAFNTTFAADFTHPVIDGKQVDSFIAGNDEQSVKTVSEMIKTVGFNPIVAGSLQVSRTLENMQLLLMQLGLKYN
ncbi:MAG: NADPH-dependent F420 reductase, partial [Ginsengibacter sp.]